LFDVSKLSFIESAASDAKSAEKLGGRSPVVKTGWGRLPGQRVNSSSVPGRLNAQLKCECIPFRPGIIELTIEIGAHGAGKKLAGSARAL
jgi:hypothetical protein